jgi:serine/threonine protein kinase
MEQTALKERYQILSTLGRGAFATTYLAEDRERGARCVVKELSLRRLDALKTHELFEREARVLKSLDHPQIPKLMDFFTVESDRDVRLYLVQEYLEGKNLADWVASGRRFTEREVVEIALGVARILEYLQSFAPPLVHRDIKPSNVLLTGEGKVHLVGFGAVRDMLHEPLLQRGGPTIVGTYGYMPLEQFEGQAVAASDVYALGATLIYLLSHKEPWQMNKDGMRLDFHSHVQVSAGLARVLDRMIEPDWKKSHASAAELRRDLEGLQVRRAASKPKALAPVAALLLTLLATAGLLTWKEAERAEAPSPSPRTARSWLREAMTRR